MSSGIFSTEWEGNSGQSDESGQGIVRHESGFLQKTEDEPETLWVPGVFSINTQH